MEPQARNLALRRTVVVVVICGAVVLCGAAALYPTIAEALPACPVRHYLGLLCPGCGGTHALLALLHGRLRDALYANAMFVLLLPAGVWFSVESCRRALSSGEFRWPHMPASMIYLLLFCAGLFTVARNI
jgi:hypothetical protein